MLFNQVCRLLSRRDNSVVPGQDCQSVESRTIRVPPQTESERPQTLASIGPKAMTTGNDRTCLIASSCLRRNGLNCSSAPKMCATRSALQWQRTILIRFEKRFVNPMLQSCVGSSVCWMATTFCKSLNLTGAADSTNIAAQTGQTNPKAPELYKKEFVFVNPASIGPNLNELIASQQIFNVR